ncbi:MAG TPA: metallopeptidase family protein [Deinococcales bacterium]|nr:metallopeptidase family protein [Deinococcales bacterium]
MTFQEFRELIAGMIDDIPSEYLDGLQGVHVLERTKRDPDEPDLLRLGEYLDPGPDSSMYGMPHLGRHVAIYYGTFAALADGDPSFDWEGEAWETLTHELTHHLESRAGEIGLIEWDRRQLEGFRRRRGP